MSTTVKQMGEILGLSPDLEPGELTKSKGVFTYRRGFFYRHGMTAAKVKDRVEGDLIKAGLKYTIIECDEVWKAFNGGAPLAKSSHWYVKFKIEE